MPRVLSRLLTPIAIAGIAILVTALPANAGDGGGNGGTGNGSIWAASWWDGSPQAGGPYIPGPAGGAQVCVWTDVGGTVADLVADLGTADLPPAFWPIDNGGYGPGAFHVIEWATRVGKVNVPYQHFDVIACPAPSMVPAPGGDIYAALPAAEPPTGVPEYIWIFWDTVPDPPPGALPPVVSQAFDSVRLPAVRIHTSPASVDGIADASIVKFPTWFWIDKSSWHTVVARAASGGYVATVWAMPVSVSWRASWDFTSPTQDPEAGVDLQPTNLDLVCDGPGTPYTTNVQPSSPSPDCGTTFTQSTLGTATPLTATVEWHVTWALSSPAGVVGGEGTFAPIEQSVSQPLRVVQIESVVTSGG